MYHNFPIQSHIQKIMIIQKSCSPFDLRHITHDEIKSSQDGNSVPKNSWSENRIEEKEGIEICQINEICTVKIDIHKSTIKVSASEYLSSESVPGSHEISYIDDGPREVLNLAEQQCKTNKNGIRPSKGPIIANYAPIVNEGGQVCSQLVHMSA